MKHRSEQSDNDWIKEHEKQEREDSIIEWWTRVTSTPISDKETLLAKIGAFMLLASLVIFVCAMLIGAAVRFMLP